jgi:3-methyladenine DNA glycosylase/8-oxoguanine DNA glycosylase
VTATVIPVPDRYDLWGSVRWAGPVAQWEGRAVLWWATTSPEGPATLRVQHTEVGEVRAEAWGDGAAWALTQAPRLLGAEDDPGAFRPPPGLLDDLARRAAGVHLGRSDRVLESLVQAILGQKVQSDAAMASARLLARRHGEPAPGPLPRPMWLLPPARVLARLDYSAFHPCNVERSRAERIIGAARRATWLEARSSTADLELLPGVGPWTAAVTASAAWGDADAVPVGDFHLPNTVCWALAREPRGDDARMLELLEPYRGHRGRVVRLLTDAQIHAPRRGPRLSIMDNRRR